MDAKLKAFVIQTLRRGTYRWVGRYEAKKNAKIARNQYVCAMCKNVFGNKDINLDHVHPVVPVEGFMNGQAWDWNEYIERMFPDKEGYQILCNSCHDQKTLSENSERRINKKAKGIKHVRKNKKLP